MGESNFQQIIIYLILVAIILMALHLRGAFSHKQVYMLKGFPFFPWIGFAYNFGSKK